MRTVLAFDVSKGNSVIVSYEESGKLIFEDQITHSRTGFAVLKQMIMYLQEEYGQTPEIVLEATGVYSKSIERFLQDNQYSYSLLNPLEASLQTKSLRRNKTDKSDAHELAKTHFKVERRTSIHKDDYYKHMRVLAREYDDLEDNKKLYKNKLHALLQLSFPEMEIVFKTKSALFLNVIQIFPHPNAILKSSKTIVKNRLKKCTSKNYSLKKLEEKAIQLFEVANESYPAIDEDDYQCKSIKKYAQKLLDLEEEQKQLINEMERLSADKKEYKVLISFPGIQKTTACRLIGEIGDIKRFKSNKQLNAYAGIDIARYQSGSIQYKDHINKRGNRRLRSILFFMIVSMLAAKGKGTNHIVEYYYKLKEQPYNKHHKVAVIACVNKFLKIAFHLIQHNILYDYEIASPSS